GARRDHCVCSSRYARSIAIQSLIANIGSPVTRHLNLFPHPNKAFNLSVCSAPGGSASPPRYRESSRSEYSQNLALIVRKSTEIPWRSKLALFVQKIYGNTQPDRGQSSQRRQNSRRKDARQPE